MAIDRSTRYPGRFDSPTTARPQGAFKNRTAPGAKDGSYLERDWANDWDGFFGSLMRSAGLSANGTPDTALASQYFDALKFLLDKKISGDNCTQAGLTAGGTLPYMKRLSDGEVIFLATRGYVDNGLLTKITGDNCTQAGFTAGGTLPYMKKTDGEVIPLATRVYVDNGLLTKIKGDNCPQAGFTAGGTLPYMMRNDGSVVAILKKIDPAMEGVVTAPTYSPGSADTRVATTAFVEERLSRVPKNTAALGEDGWWKCGDTGLIRQRRKVFVGDLVGNTTKIDVVWPVTYPNQCSSVIVTFMSLAAATSNPRVSGQYVVAAKSTYSCLVAFHEWVSEVQSLDLYILVESEGY